MSDHQSLPKARTAGLIVTELGGELLVYDAKRDFASALNPFAARVWRACDGVSDTRAIAARLSADGGYVEPEAVVRALATLAKAQLVDMPAATAPTAGRSRRQALLAVGAGAATVAIVTTIAAPAAAAGISCGGAGAPCIVPGDCCSGFTCGGGATCIGT
jgi:hypothetical protein